MSADRIVVEKIGRLTWSANARPETGKGLTWSTFYAWSRERAIKKARRHIERERTREARREATRMEVRP